MLPKPRVEFLESYESPSGFSWAEFARVFGLASIQFVWYLDSLRESNWILADEFGTSLWEIGLLDSGQNSSPVNIANITGTSEYSFGREVTMTKRNVKENNDPFKVRNWFKIIFLTSKYISLTYWACVWYTNEPKIGFTKIKCIKI